VRARANEKTLLLGPSLLLQLGFASVGAPAKFSAVSVFMGEVGV